MQDSAADQRNAEEVLSAEEVCAFAKISFDTFQRYRRNGRGPPGIHVGPNVRFFRSDVLRWLSALRDPGEP